MRELAPHAGSEPSAGCPGRIPAESLSARHPVPVSNLQRDTPRPFHRYRPAIEFHSDRVLCRRGGPSVRANYSLGTTLAAILDGLSPIRKETRPPSGSRRFYRAFYVLIEKFKHIGFPCRNVLVQHAVPVFQCWAN